ncbi:hypothetical protein KLAF111653_21505 [Klebsiella africana]|uniref:Uncharacterized protein n=1 Tax=Klebsiella africana TaxID=2489010 RepID=A0A8B6INX3_9ENTR|nr:hypothetical protein SB5857_01558 [Klebsiella africana]
MIVRAGLPGASFPSGLYIRLHADTKHSRKARKDKHIVISPAPQWG